MIGAFTGVPIPYRTFLDVVMRSRLVCVNLGCTVGVDAWSSE